MSDFRNRANFSIANSSRHIHWAEITNVGLAKSGGGQERLMVNPICRSYSSSGMP